MPGKRRSEPTTVGRLAMSNDAYEGLLSDLSKVYGWICWYCSIAVLPTSPKLYMTRILGVRTQTEKTNVKPHIDHIVARCNGGTDDFTNLALTCEFCNMAKGTKSLDTYLEWLDRIRFGDTYTPIRDGRR